MEHADGQPLEQNGARNDFEQYEEPTKQLTSIAIYRLRQAIRAQYQWTLPLNPGCRQHIPDLPYRRGKALHIVNVDQHKIALQSKTLKHVGTLKLVFTANTHHYALDDARGRGVPYRGQGPIWHQNSCHLDACIVVARLLDVGSTTADRDGRSQDAWLQALNPVQKRFLDLISADWESMDGPTNIHLRHQFWDRDLAELSGIKPRPDFGSAALVWNTCTSQMRQFSFQETHGLSSCRHCGAVPTPKTFQHHQSLSLDMSKTQFEEHKARYKEWSAKPIGWWIAQELGLEGRRCRFCNTPGGRSRQREIIGDLPQRLVVLPGPYVQGLISRATSEDVRFSYHSTDGEQKATYRWLGGIYCNQAHFRTYWTDGQNGSSSQQIKVYDGRNAYGAIIGNVPATNTDEKVPRPWSQAPIILFYERINEAALEIAAYNVRNQIENGLTSAMLLEAVGAQRAGVTTEEVGKVADHQEEEEGRKTKTDQPELSDLLKEDHSQGKDTDASENTSNTPDQPSQQGKAQQVNINPPKGPVEGDLKTQEDVVDESSDDSDSLFNETADSGTEDNGHDDNGTLRIEQRQSATDPTAEDQRKPDSESDLSSLPEQEDGEEDKENSDDNDDADRSSEDQKEKDDDEDEDEDGANGDEGPEDATGEQERQQPRSPPRSRSPPKSPPKSPSKPPQTPPPHPTHLSSLLTNLPPSKLFGLLTPTTNSKPAHTPARQIPLPALHEGDDSMENRAQSAASSPLSSPPSSGSEDEEDTSLLTTSEDEAPPLLTAPVTPTPPARRSKIITTTVRRSPRAFKRRTSTRTGQMIPPNTRTAGSMGPYKPLPASRAYVAQDAGGRGRGTFRMSSVAVGQKRSSSASSVSSTGSSAGGGRSGSGGGGGGGSTKRVRFAVVHG